MTQCNFLEETIKAGIKPMELKYSTLTLVDEKSIASYRSILQINSIDLGAMLPDQYRAIANRTMQGTKLAQWNLEKVIDKINKLINEQIPFDWISVSLPKRMLLKDDGLWYIKTLFENKKFEHQEKLCLEFSTEILYENYDIVLPALKRFKELDLKLAISDFGDEFCPTGRINGLPVDMILLDDLIASEYKNDVPEAKLVVEYAKALGLGVYIDTKEEFE